MGHEGQQAPLNGKDDHGAWHRNLLPAILYLASLFAPPVGIVAFVVSVVRSDIIGKKRGLTCLVLGLAGFAVLLVCHLAGISPFFGEF